MSENEIIVGLATIVVFGVGAQWIGRRLGFPSLLLLLPAGLLAGDVLGLVEPEELFGETLFPLVTLLVALLLFQSGLQLRLTDLPPNARQPVARLVLVGGLITFLGASLAVVTILDVGSDLAFLIGAIIVVSGPTVVAPLLESVRPRPPSGSILTWEGTVLDPVGATLGVVVLNVVLASGRGGVHPIVQMSGRLVLGIVVGLVAAALLVFVMSRFLVTDNMEAAVALLFAVLAFAAAEVLLSEAGLFATVTLGFVAANQGVVPTARIKGFGETLEVLIIGTLFILLGALVQLDALREYGWQIAGLIVVLVLVVRPASAGISLLGTALPGRERALICGIDPRGIVAAATAAQFSVTLAAGGYESDFILPVVFGVILGTGIIYGIGAKPLARGLGVAQAAPTGVGLVGNAPWLADLARCLHDCGVSVLLATTHPPESPTVANDEVPTISLLESEDDVAEALEEAGLSQVLISSKPGGLLTVVTAMFVERLGRRHVLRLPEQRRTGIEARIVSGSSVHPFGPGVTRLDVEAMLAAGARVTRVEAIGDDMLPLAAVAPDGAVDLRISQKEPPPGAVLIALAGARGEPDGG